MLVGIFQNKIKQLNPKLRFIAVNDESKPIALYYITDSNIEHICSTDRNDVPEFALHDKKGHIIKGGWRRTLMILLKKKLISKNKAEILFSTPLDGRKRGYVVEESDIDRALRQATIQLEDGIDMKKDDMFDIAAMIRQERKHAC
jgi:hypothetical protein